MGKNILLTEWQFKQYVKYNLLNERVDIQAIKANRMKSAQTLEMTPTELGEKIKEWYNNDNIEYTLKDVYLDKIANGTKDLVGVDVNTPMTFAKAASSLGFADLYNAFKVLSSRAKGNLVGPKGGKIAQQRIKHGMGFVLKDPDETSLAHANRCVAGKEARQENNRRAGYEAQDKLFKDSLKDIIANGDPNGKLPHITLTPEDKNEWEYQKISKTCYDNFIPFTENGEIYLPAKMNMKKVNELVQDNDVSPKEAIQRVPSEILMDYLIQGPKLEVNKITYLQTYIDRGVLTQPKYHYVGLGGDNESGVVCLFYVPERDR